VIAELLYQFHTSERYSTKIQWEASDCPRVTRDLWQDEVELGRGKLKCKI